MSPEEYLASLEAKSQVKSDPESILEWYKSYGEQQRQRLESNRAQAELQSESKEQAAAQRFAQQEAAILRAQQEAAVKQARTENPNDPNNPRVFFHSPGFKNSSYKKQRELAEQWANTFGSTYYNSKWVENFRKNPDSFIGIAEPKSTIGEDVLGNFAALGSAMTGAGKSVVDVFGTDSDISKSLTERRDTLRGMYSAEQQERSKQLNEQSQKYEEEGSILGQALTGAERLLTTGPGAMELIGGTAAAVVPGSIVGRVAQGAALAKGATAAAAAARGTQAATTAITATGAAMGAGSVKGGIVEAVQNASDAELMGDPSYALMRKNGLSEKQAKEQFGKEQSEYMNSPLAILAGATAGALAARLGSVEGAAAGAGGGGFVRGAGREVLTEAPQAATEVLATNLGASEAIPATRGLAEAVGAAIAGGAALGGPAGLVQSRIDRLTAQQKTPEQAPPTQTQIAASSVEIDNARKVVTEYEATRNPDLSDDYEAALTTLEAAGRIIEGQTTEVTGTAVTITPEIQSAISIIDEQSTGQSPRDDEAFNAATETLTNSGIDVDAFLTNRTIRRLPTTDAPTSASVVTGTGGGVVVNGAGPDSVRDRTGQRQSTGATSDNTGSTPVEPQRTRPLNEQTTRQTVASTGVDGQPAENVAVARQVTPTDLVGKFVQYGNARGYLQSREDGLYIVDIKGDADVLVESGLSGQSAQSLGLRQVAVPKSTTVRTQPRAASVATQSPPYTRPSNQQALEAGTAMDAEDKANSIAVKQQLQAAENFNDSLDLLSLQYGDEVAGFILDQIERKLGSNASRESIITEIENAINENYQPFQTTTSNSASNQDNAERAIIENRAGQPPTPTAKEVTQGEQDVQQQTQEVQEAAQEEVAQNQQDLDAKRIDVRKKRASLLRQRSWERNPLRAFLASHGVNLSLANEFAPGSVERRSAMVSGYGPIFRRSGKNIDLLAEAAVEEGFLLTEDANEMYDLISRVFQGERIAPLYAEGVAEQEMESHMRQMQGDPPAFDDFVEQEQNAQDDSWPMLSPEDLAETGYTQYNEQAQAEIRALVQMAESMGIDAESIIFDVVDANRNETQDEYENSAKAALEAAIEGSNRGSVEDSSQESNESEILASPSQNEVVAQQDRASTADALDQREQIRRESEAGAGTFDLAREDGRIDNTGSLLKFSEGDGKITGNTADKVNATLKEEGLDRNNIKVVQSWTPEMVQGVESGKYSQIVYHGTPYRGIDKFSTDKMGTGEGAQAYGWGLYFASKKEIADYYREQLSASLRGWNYAKEATDRGITNYEDIRQAFHMHADGQAPASMAARRIQNASIATRKVDTGKLADMVEAFRRDKEGQLYEVTIPDDTEMLLWDKPLSEQPEKVKAALQASDKRAKDSLYQDGAEYYRALTSRFAQDAPITMSVDQGENWGQKYASEYLASLGIKGIKYLDGTSRGAGEGSFNYVIFDGADTEINSTFYSKDGAGVQGFYNPANGEVTLVSDKIPEGREAGVALHEIFHRAEEAALTPEQRTELTKQVERWKVRDKKTNERQIYDAAKRRAEKSGDEAGEFLAYAIEEASNMGIQPNAKKYASSAEGWLAKVKKFFSDALKKLAPNYKGDLTADDLVDIAYGVASRDSEIQAQAKDQTETAAFKKWFGDSKATDNGKTMADGGKPLVVYHGNGLDITKFEVGKGDRQTNGNRTGVWGSYFTPSAKEASIYAEISGGDQNVMPVFVSIKNPYVMSRAEWRKHSVTSAKMETAKEGQDYARQVRAEIEVQGFDGIVIRDRGFNDEWVAFTPTQIKSATGNTGAFSPTNADIRFSLSPEQARQNVEGRIRDREEKKPRPLATRFGEGVAQAFVDYKIKARNLIAEAGVKYPELSAIGDRLQNAMTTARNQGNSVIEVLSRDVITPLEQNIKNIARSVGVNADTLRIYSGEYAAARHSYDESIKRQESLLNDLQSAEIEEMIAKDLTVLARGEKANIAETVERIRAMENRMLKAMNEDRDFTLSKTTINRHVTELSEIVDRLSEVVTAASKDGKDRTLTNANIRKVNNAMLRLMADAVRIGDPYLMLEAARKYTDAVNGMANLPKAKEQLSKAKEKLAEWKKAQSTPIRIDKDKQDIATEIETPGGMTMAEAKAIMDMRGQQGGVVEAADSMVQAYKDINSEAVRSGIITADKKAELEAEFPNYVSMSGDKNASADDDFMFSRGRNFIDKAQGRKNFMGQQDAFNNVIAKSQQLGNKVAAQALARPAFDYMIAESQVVPETERLFEKAKVPGENTMKVYSAGQTQYFKGKNEDMRFGMGELTNARFELPKALSSATRGYGSLVTQYIPMFAPINGYRDFFTRSFNTVQLRNIRKPDGSRYTMGDVYAIRGSSIASIMSPSTWGDSVKYAFTKQTSPDMESLLRNGGKMSFSDMLTSEATVSKAFKKKFPKVGKLMDVVTAYNQTFETAVILSAYKGLRANGMSEKDAAAFVVSQMNFGAKGVLTDAYLKPFYAFANPVMQDAMQVKRSLYNNGKPNYQGIAELAALAAISAFLYSMLRDASDDPEDFDAKSMMEVASNWILPNGAKIPVPFGMIQLANVIGVAKARMDQGLLTAGEAAAEVATSWFKAFSPVGSSEISASKDFGAFISATLAPTLGKPVVLAAMDKTPFGQKLTANERADTYRSEQGKRNTPEFYKQKARELREFTGSVVDMTPETAKSIFEGYAIGPLRGILDIFVDPISDREMKGGDTSSMFSPLAKALGVNRLISRSNEARATYDQFSRATSDFEALSRKFNVTVPKDRNTEKRYQKLNRWEEAGATDAEINFLDAYLEYENVTRTENREMTNIYKSGILSDVPELQEAAREELADREESKIGIMQEVIEAHKAMKAVK